MARKLFEKGNKFGKGRPKGSGSVEWCRKFAEGEGKQILLKWARSDDPKASMTATTLIYAYGIGKPTEHIEHSGSINLENVLGDSHE